MSESPAISGISAKTHFIMSLDVGYRPFEDVIESLNSIDGMEDQILLEDDRKGILRVSCNGRGLRRDFGAPGAHGFSEYVKLDDNLAMSLVSITPSTPIYHRIEHDRSISFGTQLHGMKEITPVHNTEQDNLLILGALFGRSHSETILLPNETFIAINFASSSLKNPSMLDVHTPNLDVMLTDCIEEESEYMDMCFTHHTASKNLRHCTNEMLSSPYEGQLRYDYLRAKANEFLCHFEVQCTALSTEKSEPTYSVSQSDREALQQISRNIRNSPGDDLKIKTLARDVNISENKLIAMFKKYYNESIHQYVIRVRMERAKKLLIETDLPIKEISAKVGYSDLSGFGRAYKKFFGVGPSTTRRM